MVKKQRSSRDIEKEVGTVQAHPEKASPRPGPHEENERGVNSKTAGVRTLLHRP